MESSSGGDGGGASELEMSELSKGVLVDFINPQLPHLGLAIGKHTGLSYLSFFLHNKSVPHRTITFLFFILIYGHDLL